MKITLRKGREMDALVAEKILGWTSYKQPWDNSPHLGYNVVWADADRIVVKYLPYFSTEIADAWKLLDRFKDGVAIKSYPTLNEYSVTLFVKEELFGGTEFSGMAPYVAEAICRAALKAKGMDLE